MVKKGEKYFIRGHNGVLDNYYSRCNDGDDDRDIGVACGGGGHGAGAWSWQIVS
jgi:hypothetical protein